MDRSGRTAADAIRERRAARRRAGGGEVDCASQDTIETDVKSSGSSSAGRHAVPASAPPAAAVGSSARSPRRCTRDLPAQLLRASGGGGGGDGGSSGGGETARHDALLRGLTPRLAAWDAALRSGGERLRVVPIAGDGSCLFAAAALQLYGDAAQDRRVRDAVTAHMRGEGAASASDVAATRAYFEALVRAEAGGRITPAGAVAAAAAEATAAAPGGALLDTYLERMSRGGWGGMPELVAISELYDRPVLVYTVPASAGDIGAPPAGVSLHYDGAPVDGVVPLRFSYRDASHYDAIVSVDAVAVVRVYGSADAAADDEAWDGGDEALDSEALDSDDSEEGRRNPYKYVMVIYRVPPPPGPAAAAGAAGDSDGDDDELADAFPMPRAAHAHAAAGGHAPSPWVRMWVATTAPRTAGAVIARHRAAHWLPPAAPPPPDAPAIGDV